MGKGAMVAGLVAMFGWVSVVSALIIGGGTEPVSDQNWPEGSLALANLPSRVGWWEGPPFGGGRSQFEYRGDEAALQRALDVFATINAPERLLEIKAGPGECDFLDLSDAKSALRKVDWEFAVWDPNSFYHLYNDPRHRIDLGDPNFGGELPLPELDVYLTPGRFDWSKIKVPSGLRVHDWRNDLASANGYKVGDGPVIRGTVYDFKTSKPLAGAVIILKRVGAATSPSVDSIQCNLDGKFEKLHLATGYFEIVAQCEGYAPRILGPSIFEKDTLHSFFVRLAPAAQMTGFVRDTSGGPLSGVQLHVFSTLGPDGRGYHMPTDFAATTNAEGKFTLDGLPTGSGMVTPFLEGFQPIDYLKLREFPAQDIELRMTATGKVIGNVRMLPGIRDVPTRVRIQPPGDPVGQWSGDTEIKPDGSFEFDDVPPGDYWVSSTFFLPAQSPVDGKFITVKASQTVNVDVEGKEGTK